MTLNCDPILSLGVFLCLRGAHHEMFFIHLIKYGLLDTHKSLSVIIISYHCVSMDYDANTAIKKLTLDLGSMYGVSTSY